MYCSLGTCSCRHHEAQKLNTLLIQYMSSHPPSSSSPEPPPPPPHEKVGPALDLRLSSSPQSVSSSSSPSSSSSTSSAAATEEEDCPELVASSFPGPRPSSSTLGPGASAAWEWKDFAAAYTAPFAAASTVPYGGLYRAAAAGDFFALRGLCMAASASASAHSVSRNGLSTLMSPVERRKPARSASVSPAASTSSAESRLSCVKGRVNADPAQHAESIRMVCGGGCAARFQGAKWPAVRGQSTVSPVESWATPDRRRARGRRRRRRSGGWRGPRPYSRQ